jgi:hypothetical protein
MIKQEFREESIRHTCVFEWKSQNSPRAKKARHVKCILIIFIDIKGIVHKEFVPACQTVTFAYCCDTLHQPEVWQQKNWLLHYDSTPSQTSLS